MANAHLIASLPNGLTVEVDQTGNPLIDDILVEPLAVTEGLLTLPEGPGLGIELDPAAVARLTVLPTATVTDGNYSDFVFGAAPHGEHATVSGGDDGNGERGMTGGQDQTIRVAVGQISQESNSFVAVADRVSICSSNSYLHEGDDLLLLVGRSDTEVAGMIAVCAGARRGSRAA